MSGAGRGEGSPRADDAEVASFRIFDVSFDAADIICDAAMTLYLEGRGKGRDPGKLSFIVVCSLSGKDGESYPDFQIVRVTKVNHLHWIRLDDDRTMIASLVRAGEILGSPSAAGP